MSRDWQAVINEVADHYRHANGLDASPSRFGSWQFDKVEAWKVAAWYEARPVEPYPMARVATRQAYEAFVSELFNQSLYLGTAGIRFNYVDSDPYPNSAAMLSDLYTTGRIRVLKTEPGTLHSYLTEDANNLFRAVHDVFGHGVKGYGFGPSGEEGAFREHLTMFSPTAQRALATETKGQNSWFNFGPYSHLPTKERPFAVQKAALFPTQFLPPIER
jgi:hypothetical protein